MATSKAGEILHDGARGASPRSCCADRERFARKDCRDLRPALCTGDGMCISLGPRTKGADRYVKIKSYRGRAQNAGDPCGCDSGDPGKTEDRVGTGCGSCSPGCIPGRALFSRLDALLQEPEETENGNAFLMADLDNSKICQRPLGACVTATGCLKAAGRVCSMGCDGPAQTGGQIKRG